jgi:hypothetical protein
MRGFQAANDVRKGELLRDVLANDPNHVYSGLLTVLLRLVFVMYAEDRDLLSSDPVYSNYYSVTGLFDRLRSDAGRFPDTMDQRFGAWSQLITLFRLIYEGGQHNDFKLPRRKGYLFDPDRYPFLEGRPRDSIDRGVGAVPHISDGVIFRVLRNLLILDGERLSYRTLDVEQIGSVYETVMGFNLEVAAGKSIAIKPVKSHGAPATINLEALLETAGKDRAKWLKEHADQKITGAAMTELKAAETIDELLMVLDKKIKKTVTPRVVPAGAIVLQPSDERRRSGSHYTPRSLTEPIVRTTLEPILKQLVGNTSTQRKQVSPAGKTGTDETHSLALRACIEKADDLPSVYEPSREDKRRYTKGELAARIRLSSKAVEAAEKAREVGTPDPSQLLDLKICDPAMGSGAFLVETCRRLGDELVTAWYAHDSVPTDIPPDEDEVLYARRLIAQRCLYGVDKNDMAVDLAKLSLWLVTLAKDHPFTFLDHSLRHGDSLVGLTRRQIIGFHWEPKKQKQFGEDLIQKRLDRATEARAKILNAREDVPYRDQEQRLAVADEALNVVRMTGDACVSAFFAGSKKKEREDRCEELFGCVSEWYASGHDINKRGPIAAAAAELRSGEHPIPPFHWEIEFPEVFSGQKSGFDGYIGNPPFLGGRRTTTVFGETYRDYLALFPDSSSNADLCSYFFRRCYELLTQGGMLSLIATNSIAQGDTRQSGLCWLCENGANIYKAERRYKWPGDVAVVVSVVHILKGDLRCLPILDGRPVERITAYLFHAGPNRTPPQLAANANLDFQGSIILGTGFTFGESDEAGSMSSLAEMDALIAQDPRNGERIFPFIGGAELNDSPTHEHKRYVINLGDMSEDEAREWPQLVGILEDKVKPERGKQKRKHLRERWWQHAETRPAMYRAIASLDRVLATSQVCAHLSFAFMPSTTVFSNKLTVFALSRYSEFCSLQSRCHEVWARFFSGSAMDLLRYTPRDCFQTYPFPANWQNDRKLETIGSTYYDHRSTTMFTNSEGLTDTYNRFHDPHEKSPEIAHLRELHEAMDRAVLETYGWDDLAAAARCEFLLDYEEEDDENESGRKSKKKKPWRLRWPDDFRDEVLARLLELNEQRAKEEALAGAKPSGSKPKKQVKPKESAQKEMLF